MALGESDFTTRVDRPRIRHYYGDRVRFSFVATAVISFISIPIWGYLLPLGLTAQIIGGLLLVLLAGLTSPHSKTVMAANAAVAGIGALLLEATAINQRATSSIELLIVREIGVILLLFAFYYSVKSVRAMFQHTIGKTERPWEFEDESPR